jgi:hypothetical protein
MSARLLERRRALFDLAIAATDTSIEPAELHAIAIRALEASYAAELGLNIASSEESRLTNLMGKFRTAFKPDQSGLFGGGS